MVPRVVSSAGEGCLVLDSLSSKPELLRMLLKAGWDL